MQLGPLDFRPGLVPTLVVALLLPLLVGLGFWQLDRAAQKQARIDSLQAGARAEPVDLNESLPPFTKVRHRRATATGRFDARRQFLLDNQVQDGRVGYRTMTPLRLAGSDGLIMVDRGWVAAPPRRSQLPSIAVGERRRTVSGVIERGPSVGIRLGEPAEADAGWPRRLVYVDYDYMAAALNHAIPSYVLRVLDDGTESVAAVSDPELGPERHRGYAVQWFALATALVAIYLGVNTRRLKRGAASDR